MNNQAQSAINTYVPFSEEAEEAALGGIVVDNAQLKAVKDKLVPEDFFLLRHQYIFEAMLAIDLRGEPIDYITLADELKNVKRLEDVGGAAYIIHLVNGTPTAHYVPVYAALVGRAATRRRLMTAADEIKALAFDEELSLEKVCVQAEGRIKAVTARTHLSTNNISMRDLVSQTLDDLDAVMEGTKAPKQTYPLGFKELDGYITLENKDLLIFAGRPGMGKSAAMFSAAVNIAEHTPVFFSTMEMNVDQAKVRLVCALSGLDTQKVANPRLLEYGSGDDNSEYVRYHRALAKLSTLPIIINAERAVSPARLRVMMREAEAAQGKSLVMVDYVGKMETGDSRLDWNDFNRISYCIRSLKDIAGQFDTAIITGSQVGRDVEDRKNKRPVLSDLRSSGDQEQETDIVIALYRDEVYNPATEFPNQTEFIILKNRQGPTGTATMYWDKQAARFQDARRRQIDLTLV